MNATSSLNIAQVPDDYLHKFDEPTLPDWPTFQEIVEHTGNDSNFVDNMKNHLKVHRKKIPRPMSTTGKLEDDFKTTINSMAMQKILNGRMGIKGAIKPVHQSRASIEIGKELTY